MAYENITKINIIGTPELPIPAGMTVESVLTTMGYNIDDYEQSVEGTTLVLAASAGTKGALEVRIVEGKVLPKGGLTFPTDRDIDMISKLFPEDDLFRTLELPEYLQKYLTAIEENAEKLILEAAVGQEEKLRADAEASVEELKSTLDRIEIYATKTSNPIQAAIIAHIQATTDKLSGLLKLAEECEVQTIRTRKEEEERERILASIRNNQA